MKIAFIPAVFFFVQGIAAPGQTVGPLQSYAATAPAGRSDFDVADRLAIINLIGTYSLAYDNYDADAWFDLFTPDAVFAVGTPGMKPLVLSGDAMRKAWRARIANFKSTGNKRRHLMSNIVFLEQTGTTAHVSIVGLLTNAKDGKTFTAVSSLNYEGWFVKINGVWKISRWHDFPDTGV
jgi:ketosteroid isomerase-like protein